MTPRWRLFTKYASFIIALVTAALLASGMTSLYFSYRENQDHLQCTARRRGNASGNINIERSSVGPHCRRSPRAATSSSSRYEY
jgi:hypothetical protein